MNLTISYNNLYHNWYVGEFYTAFHEKIKNLEGINVEYINSRDLSTYHNIPSDYCNGFPSIFNPYNLIITNKDNGKTFVHSWHDYAPATLVNGSGIELLDVVKFACVSRLDKSIIENNKTNITIQPSIYLLENWNEHNLIETHRHNKKTSDKIFFNGLCYGVREQYKKLLTASDFFDFKRKDGPDYKNKEDYYLQMSSYKHGLSLDGAAKICYRDIEYFGMGITLFREELDVLTSEPIIPNEHYFVIIDDEIKKLIYENEKLNYVLEKIEHNVQNILNNYDIERVVNNARGWFERNALPQNQLNIFIDFMEDFKIFE
jgi:hypothetical protein